MSRPESCYINCSSVASRVSGSIKRVIGRDLDCMNSGHGIALCSPRDDFGEAAGEAASEFGGIGTALDADAAVQLRVHARRRHSVLERESTIDHTRDYLDQRRSDAATAGCTESEPRWPVEISVAEDECRCGIRTRNASGAELVRMRV